MLISFVIFILGLVILIAGAEFMVRGSVGIAQRAGLSKVVIGLTVVAFGTSAPELVVSVIAAVQGSSDVSIGNVVGSNIANIGLIVGITAFILPIAYDRSLLKMDQPMLFLSMAALIVLSLDGSISRWDAGALFLGLILFIVITYRNMSRRGEEPEGDSVKAPRSMPISVAGAIVGIAGLTMGARLMVKGAVDMARIFDVPELVIGATIVAVGTSLPELATSLVAVLRKEHDIGLGNVIGSNIFNVCCVLGIAPLIRPLSVNPDVVRFEYPAMVGFAAALLLMMAKKSNRIGRLEGALLFSGFVLFLAFSFLK